VPAGHSPAGVSSAFPTRPGRFNHNTGTWYGFPAMETTHDPIAKFTAAVAAHTAGDLDAAAVAYRNIIQAIPNHAGALANLAQIVKQRGDLQAAIRLYQQAARQEKAGAEVFFNLGNAHREAGDFTQALAAYRRAIALNDQLAPAHCALGIVQQRQGEFQQALAAFECAVQRQPALWRAWQGRGEMLLREKCLDDGLQCLHEACKLAPEENRPWRLLARALHGCTRFKQAIAAFRQIKADSLGIEDLTTWAECCWQLEDYDGGFALLRKAIVLAPENPDVHANLANCLREVWHLGAAVESLSRALELCPNHNRALMQKAHVLASQGRIGETFEVLDAAIGHYPDDEAIGHNILFASLYRDDISPEAIRDTHRQWAAKWETREKLLPASAAKHRAHERIHLAYLSPDLHGDHPVAQFMAPVLHHHDREQVQLTAYYAGKKFDAVSEKFKAQVDTWRDVAALSNRELARQIVDDGVDVLVDLAGHTAGTRLSVFAHRPAPVQMSFLGYPFGTGSVHVDYLIADACVCPESERALYEEQILCLPHCVFAMPDTLPEEITPDCSDPDQAVTFGNFGNLPKLSPSTVQLFADVLKAVPDSRLLLKSGGLADTDTQQHVRQRFAAQDIADDRLLLRGPSPFAEMLEHYTEVDVVLDTIPYNGGTTSFHALWMGCAMVTWPGRSFCGRMGASILGAAGYPQWIADSRQGYIDIAARLAADTAKLRDQRAGIRSRLQQSPLADHKAYVKDLEILFKGAIQCL